MTTLLEAQRQLQAEADEVVHDLQLEELLGRIGKPIRVGSSAMGLMVRRDIDITTVCHKLDAATLEAFTGIAASLMQSPTKVGSVRFRNDCGIWNKEPEKYPDGLYLGLSVIGRKDTIWTLDIWAVDDPARQPDLGHLENLLPRLTTANRLKILQIKGGLAEGSQAKSSIPSVLVYEAVVDHGVQTTEAFVRWYDDRIS